MERSPNVIAAGNIGFMMQIRSTVYVTFLQTAELLDLAKGSPVPPAPARIKKLNFK